MHLKTSANACTQTLLYISYVHVFISVTNYMDMLGTLEEYEPHGTEYPLYEVNEDSICRGSSVI